VSVAFPPSRCPPYDAPPRLARKFGGDRDVSASARLAPDHWFRLAHDARIAAHAARVAAELARLRRKRAAVRRACRKAARQRERRDRPGPPPKQARPPRPPVYRVAACPGCSTRRPLRPDTGLCQRCNWHLARRGAV
jgi:hypothetical protein